MNILDELKSWLPRPVPALREASVQGLGPHGLHRMRYVEWGDADNPKVLICVHGLTRNGRDFDVLACALADEYRVVCPDVVGRGRSDRLPIADDYAVPVYASDMMVLIARLNVETVHWVGTSMGGMIGMTLACMPDSPVTRMVLNDVGPVVPLAALTRIAAYVGKAPPFASIEVAETYLRTVAAPFGPLSDAQWRHLATHGTRARPEGGFEMAYDPAIAQPFGKAVEQGADIDLWGLYDAVRCPTLVLRGAQSDVLLHETAEEMSRRGPQAKIVEFPGIGHAPMLMDETQVRIVREFLLAKP